MTVHYYKEAPFCYPVSIIFSCEEQVTLCGIGYDKMWYRTGTEIPNYLHSPPIYEVNCESCILLRLEHD